MLNISLVNISSRKKPKIATVVVTILNQAKISLNCWLSTFTAFRNKAIGGPLTDILPVRNPQSAPAILTFSFVCLIEYFTPNKVIIDKTMKKIPITNIRISPAIYFSARVPNMVKKSASVY